MLRTLSGKLTFRAFVTALLMLLGIGFVVWQSPRFGYAGHTPFATPAARAWLTVGLCMLWLVGWGVAALTRRIARVRITWDTALPLPPPVEADDDCSAAIALDRQDHLFRSARRLLRGGGPWWRLGRHSLYRLPWYLLLGGEGSGKSALLSASRLKFSEQDEEAAPRPDDPCRFWLGDEAVLIEARGRLAFPGIQPDMAYPLWRRLLKLLRRARRRCPINGVIVTISAMDALAGEECLAAQVRGLRARLREMQRFFDIQFPVYVVVTHCDRLAGFEAFFRHLDRAAADQTWGVTFAGPASEPDDAPLAAFPKEFATLVQRLQHRIVHLLGAGGDAANAGKVYGFPAQFETLGEPLRVFLYDVFGKSPYAPTAWLRGVYFTSAAQDGEAPPRRASALAAAVQGAALFERRPLTNPQGYFIVRLLRNVVFQEHGLARRSLAFGRRRAIWRYSTSAVIVAAVIAGAGVLYAGYQRNQALVIAVDRNTAHMASLAAAAGAGGTPADPAAILALLDAAWQPVASSGPSISSTVLLRRVGLYQGEALAEAARSTYGALSRQTLLPFVRARARQAMSDPLRDYMARFRALRTYLMIGGQGQYDAAAVLAWVGQDIRQLPLTESQRADMVAHARALFMSGVVSRGAIDASLVARVRAELAAQPLADRLFDALLSELRAAVPDALSVAKLGGVDAPLVLRRASGRSLSEGVPGAYTVAGYGSYLALRDTLVADAARDQWVLGTSGAPQPGGARLRAELDHDYFSHYIAAWDALLDDVRAGNIGADTGGSAAVMHLLAASDSPLRRFLQGAAAQTTLAGIQDPAAASTAPNGAPNITFVDQHFDALHQLFRGREGGAVPYADIQAKLGAAAVFLDAVDAARQRGLPPPPDDAVRSLHDAAEGQPAPLGDLLRDLASDGRVLASNDLRRRLDELWRANVAPFCHAALDGRYPVDAQSNLDMTQDDFNRLLGPGGLIDAFFQANLLPYVDMTAHPWRLRPNAARLRLSRATLQAFEDAATIRQAFFPDGQKAMSVRFQLLPLSLDPYFTRFSLTLGGQTLEYTHGPARPVSFLWPDSGVTSSARIDYEPGGADGRSGASVSGPWALFHLLNMGTLEPVRADRFILDFMLSGKRVSLQLDAGSVMNPFALAALHRFRCMDRLGETGPSAMRSARETIRTVPSQSPAM